MGAPCFCEAAEASWLTAADGKRLRALIWRGREARGTIVIFPGRTEHAEKYERVAAAFVARGFAVAALDWRGQGLSDRLISETRAGHVDDFAEYQLDAAAYLTHLADLPRPLYLLAHSMGGCIGLRLLMAEHPFEKSVFSAPMWGINFPAPLRPIAPILARMADGIGLGARFAAGTGPVNDFVADQFEGNSLTTDRGEWNRIRDQLTAHPELAIGGPTWRWLRAAIAEMDALAARPSPDLPAMALLGSEESVTSPARIRARMAGWGPILDLPGRQHEALMEGEAHFAPLIEEISRFFTA